MKRTRCPWAYGASPLYIPYHDKEWGVPVHEDRLQFEFLTLESAQAGLSWATVLNKREGYRRAFAGFDPEKVARFTPEKIERLLKDPGIIRNRLKVRASITPAVFWKCKKNSGPSQNTSGVLRAAGPR